jgi:hypothetical protein
VNPDGTGHVAVTSRPRTQAERRVRYGTPRWSANGDTLAYLAFETGGPEGTSVSRVFARGSSGAVPRELYASAEISLLTLGWSPGGRYLGFVGAARGSSDLQLHRLRVVSHEDSGGARPPDPVRVLTGRPLYWQFCGTDGSLLVHVDGTRPYGGRVTLIPPGKSAAPLVLEDDPTAFRAPACNPATPAVLLASHSRPGAAEDAVEDASDAPGGRRPGYVVLANRETGDKRLVSEVEGRSAFSIGPNGRRAAGIDGTLGRFGAIRGQLWIAELGDDAGVDSEDVADAPSVMAAFWSPDGTRLVYFQPAFDAERASELLVRFTVLDFADGSKRTFGPLYVSPVFANEVIYRFDQFARNGTMWAPDSSAITMGLIDATGRPGVYVVPVTPGGGAPRRIASGDLPVWRPGAGSVGGRIATVRACSSYINICIFPES